MRCAHGSPHSGQVGQIFAMIRARHPGVARTWQPAESEKLGGSPPWSPPSENQGGAPIHVDHEQASLRSQSGPLVGVAFSTTLSSFLNRIDLASTSATVPLMLLATINLHVRGQEARLPCGECWGAHLSRRRRQCLPRSAAASRHNGRVSIALRRFSTPQCCQHQWRKRCLGRNTPPQGENVSRTRQSPLKSGVGGFGWWWGAAKEGGASFSVGAATQRWC